MGPRCDGGFGLHEPELAEELFAGDGLDFRPCVDDQPTRRHRRERSPTVARDLDFAVLVEAVEDVPSTDEGESLPGRTRVSERERTPLPATRRTL